MNDRPDQSYHKLTPARDNSIKRSSRSGEYLRWRVNVADAYRAAGMVDEGDAFEQCSDPSHFFMLSPGDELPVEAIKVVVCSDHPDHLSKGICPSCQLRTCPDCAHREAARLLARYMPTLQQYFRVPYRPGWKFRSVVFTAGVSLHDGDVRQQVKHLYTSVRKVFENALKSRPQGAVAISDTGILLAHEFGPNGLKLHIHGLYYGPWLDQPVLADLWQRYTGWQVVYISGVGKSKEIDNLEDAVAEVVKYTTKFWKREKSGKVVFVDPKIVPVLHKVIEGTRRVRTWGLFYDIQEVEEKAACPTCGAPLALLSRLEWDAWSQTGFKPDELRAALRGDVLLNSIHGNKSPPWEPDIGIKQGRLL